MKHSTIIIGLGSTIAAFIIAMFVSMDNPQIKSPVVPSQPETKSNEYPVNRYHEQSETVSYDKDLAIHITHKVTWDEKDELYIYYYKIEHAGPNMVFLSWEILNKTMNCPMLIKLDGKAEKEITIRSKLPPVKDSGAAVVFRETKMSVEGVAILDSVWTPISQSVSGPIPGLEVQVNQE